MAKKEQPWPSPIGEAGYHGIIGDYLRAIEPHSEGDPAAILVQTVVCLGNAMGRAPYFMVENNRHGTNLFTVIVGDTASARKGTSLGRALALVQAADPVWGQNNHGEGGLSTSEGLINAVRDPSDFDPIGVVDKRRLAAMGEFSETLIRMKGADNSLSTTLRSTWDGNTLRTLTRKAPMTATDAHISVIGHITEADLTEQLGSVQVFNGFGNRFLWVMATRSKHLAFGGELEIDDLPELVTQVRKALRWSQRSERRIDFDAKAAKMWPELYADLGHSEGGRFGAITDRAEAQVRRLALIYAVMDRSQKVTRDHLNAALEIWRYCEESAAYVFAEAPANPVEGTVLRLLEGHKGWLARAEINRRGFKGEIKAYRLTSALNGLLERKLIEQQRIPTRGRTRTEYRLRRR